MVREPDPTADRLFWGRASGLCREQAQKPRGEEQSGSHCILLENISSVTVIKIKSQVLAQLLPGYKTFWANYFCSDATVLISKMRHGSPQPHWLVAMVELDSG